MQHPSGKQPQTNWQWRELDKQFRLQSRQVHDIVLQRGEGCRVWDVEGKEYLDLMSGQLCVSVGHSHPTLVEAVARQSAQIMQTGMPFTTPQEVSLAQKIAELAPGDLQKTAFGTTGSESNEYALRMAKFYTGHSELAALVDGYAGLTYGSWSVTGRGSRSKHPEYGVGMPGVSFLPTPNPYRCLFCKGKGACDLSCLEYSVELLDSTTSGQPAAIILEPVISSGGVIVPTKEYMQGIRRMCDERGALMILDEAQTGFGRTGKWFACEHLDVIPDILTVSKSLGGSVPLSAVVMRPHIAQKLEDAGFHQGSSHMGDPFLCAVGLANLEIIEEEDLVGNGQRMGDYFKSQLEALMEYEIIGDVRGLGLLLGVEIVRDKESREPAEDILRRIESYCMDHGLILFVSARPSVIRIAPPLVISKQEVDRALTILEEGIRYAIGSGRS